MSRRKRNLFTEPLENRREGDPHIVLEFPDGHRWTNQIRFGRTVESAWDYAAAEGLLVDGEKVRVGIAYAFLMCGEPLADDAVVEWIGYHVYEGEAA